MRTKVRAAVMVKARELQVELLDLEEPHDDELVVEIAATGICHSDLSVYQAVLPTPLPVVLGHESAGTVVGLGAGVSGLALGDHVVLSLLAQCGKCFYCNQGQQVLCESGQPAMLRGTMADGTTRFAWGGTPVFQMAGLGTLAQRVVVPATAVVAIPKALPLVRRARINRT